MALLALSGGAQGACPSGPSCNATLMSCAMVQVVWGSVSGADGYDVYRQGPGDATYVLVSSDQTGTSYNDFSIAVGGSYTYRIAAREDNIFSCPDGVGSQGPASSSVTRPVPPGTPVNITSSGTCGVDLAWGVGGTVTAFTVRRGTSNDFAASAVIGTASSMTPGSWTYHDGTVAPGTTYYYWGVAQNECAPGGASAATLVTPGAAAAPAAGGVVTATGADCNIHVSWPAVAGAATYQLSIDNGAPVTVAGTSYGDPAPIGTTRTYKVRGVNGCGPGAYGPAASATSTASVTAAVLAHPQGLVVNQGQTAVISASVAALNPMPGMQWLRDGVPVPSDPRISGATTATLTITGAKLADTASYSLKLTGSCNTGTTTPAVLGVRRVCGADYNEQNGVDLLDIFGFLNAWFAGCP